MYIAYVEKFYPQFCFCLGNVNVCPGNVNVCPKSSYSILQSIWYSHYSTSSILKFTFTMMNNTQFENLKMLVMMTLLFLSMSWWENCSLKKAMTQHPVQQATEGALHHKPSLSEHNLRLEANNIKRLSAHRSVQVFIWLPLSLSRLYICLSSKRLSCAASVSSMSVLVYFNFLCFVFLLLYLRESFSVPLL